MIKRLTNPAEFKIALDDIFDLFGYENENEGHQLLRHNKEYISNAFADESVLVWDFFVWANLNEHNKYDATIAFSNQKNEKFGEEIFSEYIWMSANPNVGYKLLTTALKFAKEKEFKYVTMTCAMGHPKAQKIGRFYEKMGFVKDSETYIAKL
tara:strand:+ start:4278 stop:4736 length:459 start_codon:yes stop_codon:yes gene_type:complete